ncbi:hypothetical protein AA309_17540 [Microvirga vignae]|uniref:Uncharacterized protein n=1 Tax=Microvirga vignae TaxID=1225564 RepID=A0A0H1R9P5_9HYPH|nr:hypothetical protein AA309_17540 [Microvirga vignae]
MRDHPGRQAGSGCSDPPDKGRTKPVRLMRCHLAAAEGRHRSVSDQTSTAPNGLFYGLIWPKVG